MTRIDARHNREQIMQAFHKATRTDIVALPTMSEIVKLSGLGRGTVYRHFPDIGSLAFSFLTSGYEALFEESRTHLQSAESPTASFTALRNHLTRYRTFSKENLSVLLRPECLSSEGYALAQKSHRQCVNRALRDMTGFGRTPNHLLASAVDVICRVAEPEHLKEAGIKQTETDSLSGETIQMALEFASKVSDSFLKR